MRAAAALTKVKRACRSTPKIPSAADSRMRSTVRANSASLRIDVPNSKRNDERSPTANSKYARTAPATWRTEIADLASRLRALPVVALTAPDDTLFRAVLVKLFSDRQLATIWNSTDTEVRRVRKEFGVEPVFKLVDTCAAEFEAYTPYYYSTYERPFSRPPQAGAGPALAGCMHKAGLVTVR